ncbi:MAG: microcin C transport system substrate-binding protein [Rhodospirillaceae bacterium]|nr:MAG: microcin C transport system substrate-binding protein [Rhodospirillaceae bacterium]
MRFSIVRQCCMVLVFLAMVSPLQAEPRLHAIAIHGAPKYPPDFKHFDYVNPDAPKGGTVKMGVLGTFDSFNPYIIKGQAFSMMNSLVFETLMVSSTDDPSTAYGLIAESVEVPSDRSWVAFTVRPQARWHDGTPITADDVLWSFETLRTKGQPLYRLYYADVAGAEKTDERRVRFVFKPGTTNNELPIILGQLPVLPRHDWATRAFDQTTLEVPLGSGPYRIDGFEAGRHIVLRRDPTYWGRDLPVNKGTYNFDTIHVDYYRDYTVALEAFRAGAYDYRPENSSKAWATAYTFPAVTSGQVIREEIPHQRPQGMQAFVFNTRRPLFQDPRVRRALAYAFDFEWANKNLFYGQYVRGESYFANSELAAVGLPDAREMEILEPLRGQIPEDVFTTPYTAPRTDGSGTLRDNLRLANRLLEESGWTVKNQVRVQAQTGKPFVFELLLEDPIWERIAAPFVQNLKRLGIAVTVRLVDSTVYENRIRAFDFDMVVYRWLQTLSPGNEQRNHWSSQGADMEGGNNLIGIKSAAIDALVEQVNAGSRAVVESFRHSALVHRL